MLLLIALGSKKPAQIMTENVFVSDADALYLEQHGTLLWNRDGFSSIQRSPNLPPKDARLAEKLVFRPVGLQDGHKEKQEARMHSNGGACPASPVASRYSCSK